MDNKDGRKKESIDEILSDLNGLLNKMPSILDGIRMPEIKPAEFPAEPVYRTSEKSAPSPVPAPEPEARPAPAEIPVQPDPAPADGDKTMILPAFADLSEGADAPAQEKLVPQSLGDFMFGEKEPEAQAEPASPAPVKLSGAPLEPPAEQPAVIKDSPEKGGLVISEFTAPEGKEPEAPLPQASMDFQEPEAMDNFSLQDALPAESAQEPAVPEISVPETDKASAAPAPVKPDNYTGTGDFGVPDIDAMLLMSNEENPEPAPVPAAETSAEAVLEPLLETAAQPSQEEPAPAPAQEPELIEPGSDELAEFERHLKDAAPQGDAMDNKPEDSDKEKQGEAALPEGLILEPSAAAAQPEEAPAPDQQAAAEPAVEPAVEPAAGEIQLSVNEPAPDAVERTHSEINLAANEPAPSAAPKGGLVLEPASALFSDQPKPEAGSGDETLVVPPPSGDEDKTMVYDPGTSPGVTSRSKAKDLDGLAQMQVPQEIPAERVRSVVFLYAAEEKAFCASVLTELDAICLKSAEKPMFIKRASVKECDPEINGNYVLQTVADSGAQGLVCVGNIPQEKVFEIESAFTSAGKFFRHYDSAGFSHSAALDLVSDLILC